MTNPKFNKLLFLTDDTSSQMNNIEYKIIVFLNFRVFPNHLYRYYQGDWLHKYIFSLIEANLILEYYTAPVILVFPMYYLTVILLNIYLVIIMIIDSVIVFLT